MFIFHRTRKKTNFVISNDLIVFFLIYRLFKTTEEQSKVFQDAGIMGRARDINNYSKVLPVVTGSEQSNEEMTKNLLEGFHEGSFPTQV